MTVIVQRKLREYNGVGGLRQSGSATKGDITDILTKTTINQ